MGLLWGESGVTLRVTWVFFGLYPGGDFRSTQITLRVVWGHYEGPWGSLWGYPGVTLSVPLGHFEGTLGSLWDSKAPRDPLGAPRDPPDPKGPPYLKESIYRIL